MTDKELIQALRHCADDEGGYCKDCVLLGRCGSMEDAMSKAAKHLEALLAENAEMNIQIQKEICKRVDVEAENEHLREATKMIPRWRSVSEPPEEPGYYLCRVKSFVSPGRFYVNILGYDKDGFREGHIYTDDVTHWMPLPSTEGVE